jgi:hypothetical protein
MQPDCTFGERGGIDDGDFHQPYAATSFSSGGHFGSTVWDPMSGHRELMINVCDECLVKHKDRVSMVVRTPRPSIFDYQPWDPKAYD